MSFTFYLDFRSGVVALVPFVLSSFFRSRLSRASPFLPFPWVTTLCIVLYRLPFSMLYLCERVEDVWSFSPVFLIALQVEHVDKNPKSELEDDDFVLNAKSEYTILRPGCVLLTSHWHQLSPPCIFLRPNFPCPCPWLGSS